MLEPVEQTRFIHHDSGRLRARVVVAEDFQETPISWAFFFRGDDAVARLVASADST